MRKQVKIKEIAQMAGVSAGTVDRILHNRGNVSEKSRKAVEEVLENVDYRFNLHTSAVSLKKTYKILITTPAAIAGEYWGAIHAGIEKALHEYSDISIVPEYVQYDQFDVFSCRTDFGKIMDRHPDGVIIGPTFNEETIALCSDLDNARIPYVFVDAHISGTNPVASFAIDQEACGMLLGRLLFNFIPNGSKAAIFEVHRKGNSHSNNTLGRERGLSMYAEANQLSDRLIKAKATIRPNRSKDKEIMNFLNMHKDIKGIAVMNSRGHILAEILRRNNIEDICIISFDMTDSNVRCLRDGSLSVLLCQRPQMQGFESIKAIIGYLLYKQREKEQRQNLPIDIIMKENLPFYKEIIVP